MELTPKTSFLTLLILLPVFTATEHLQADSGDAKTVAETIPITMANIRGHKALYKEGWLFVSSSERAFQHARKHSIEASGRVLADFKRDVARDSSRFSGNMAAGLRGGIKAGKNIFFKGTRQSGRIFKNTHTLGKTQLQFGQQALAFAWDNFVTGNLSLVRRTEADRRELMGIPGGYFNNLKNDFSNVYQLIDGLTGRVRPLVEVSWPDAFNLAASKFNAEYESSGDSANTLTGLYYITAGYLKAFYYGLFKPGVMSLGYGAVVTANLAGKAIFLPAAGVLIITGRTVQSVGQSLYYGTRVGFKVISPTLESGLLAAFSLGAVGLTPLTYTTGSALGLVNQVVVTTVSPIAGTGIIAVQSGKATIKYGALLCYDLAKGSSRVVIHNVFSGIVLGYNALTAIPLHLIMGSANTIFFLAWDGPRLVIASARGKVTLNDGSQSSVEDLPVGSVVDLKKLKKEPGLEVEVISDDPEVINNVLEKLPEDLREKK